MRNILTFIAGLGVGLSPFGNLPMKLFFGNVKDVSTCLNWLDHPNSAGARFACYPADPTSIVIANWMFIIVGVILLFIAAQPLLKEVFGRKTV